MDKLIKLKINGDDRLWTDRVYINGCGQHLVLFDKLGDHAAVDRARRDSKGMQFIFEDETSDAGGGGS